MEQSKKITAIYCRTATPDSTAIDVQRESLLRYAEAHGFGNTQVFEDDGFTGSNPDRPAFTLLNEFISAGCVARVLARSVTRLGRNTAEVLAWAREAQAQGVEVSTLDMGADTLTEQFAVWEAAPELAAIADQAFVPDTNAGSLHERFAVWLSPQRACGLAGDPQAEPQAEAFTFYEGGSHCTMIRVTKNDDFDYLYCQRNYHGSGIKRSSDFEYAGIYCKSDGFVYDDQTNIRVLRHEALTRLGAARMLERLEAEVRGAVEAAIGNDLKNLKVQELTAERYLNNLDYFVKHCAASRAREMFLSGADDWAAYRCPYEPERWTEESLLEYILDPEGYTAREAAAYIDSHQEAILLDFLTNSATAEEYVALAGNPRHPAHRIRGIMEAVNASPAVTVRVTIRKDGTEFSFKVNADDLRRDCGSSYITWHIAAADRREFERLFGRGASYGPEHILRIEYARSVLYEAEVAA